MAMTWVPLTKPIFNADGEGANCGTGAGGFKPGNKCAKGGHSPTAGGNHGTGYGRDGKPIPVGVTIGGGSNKAYDLARATGKLAGTKVALRGRSHDYEVEVVKTNLLTGKATVKHGHGGTEDVPLSDLRKTKGDYAKAVAREVAKEIGSKEFGGSQKASVTSDGHLKIEDSYHFGGSSRSDHLAKEWGEGGAYSKYFGQTYGVKFKQIDSYQDVGDKSGGKVGIVLKIE